MPYFQVPSRRTRQPQTIARPSSYWLSRGLVFLYNGATFVDHVYGIPATNSGSVSRRVNPSGGIAADISGTQYLAWASSDALNLTGALAIIWKGRFDGTTGAYRTVFSKAQSNGATNTPFESYVDTTSGKLAFIRANGTANRYWQCDTNVVPANADLTLFINAPSAIESLPTIYIGATAQTISGSGTATGSATASTSELRIGRRVDNGTQFDGGVELVALFNQQLSTDDYLRFRSDPWGEAFAPNPRRIYFGAGGGAGETTWTYAPSGGVTLGGTAPLLRTKVHTSSGGVTLAGTAATDGKHNYAYTSSGGLTVAGTAPVLKGKVYAPSGGIAIAGTAPLLKGKVYGVSGGVTLAGAATTSYGVAGATSYPYQPSGGIALAGAATTTATKFYVAPISGGITFAGTAPSVYTSTAAQTYTYTGTGDIVLTGVAVTVGPQVIGYSSPSYGGGGGGGGASVKRWMKDSGVDADIEKAAEKLGLKVEKKKKDPPRKTEVTKPALEVVSPVAPAVPAAAETVSRADFDRLEARLVQMEATILKQLKRRDEEYFIWRALAEKVI